MLRQSVYEAPVWELESRAGEAIKPQSPVAADTYYPDVTSAFSGTADMAGPLAGPPSPSKMTGRGRCRHPLHHSGLMPAYFTTLPHFAVSSMIKRPKSAGEPAIVVPPNSARRALIFGSPRQALISVLRLSTI
jgi:hypothetical protein